MRYSTSTRVIPWRLQPQKDTCMSMLSLAALGALGMGLAAVAWTTWQNSKATSSMGQLLYKTEQLPRSSQKIDPRRFENERSSE